MNQSFVVFFRRAALAPGCRGSNDRFVYIADYYNRVWPVLEKLAEKEFLSLLMNVFARKSENQKDGGRDPLHIRDETRWNSVWNCKRYIDTYISPCDDVVGPAGCFCSDHVLWCCIIFTYEGGRAGGGARGSGSAGPKRPDRPRGEDQHTFRVPHVSEICMYVGLSLLLEFGDICFVVFFSTPSFSLR